MSYFFASKGLLVHSWGAERTKKNLVNEVNSNHKHTLLWKINSEMVFAKDQIHIVKAEDASYFSTIMSIGV